MGIVASRYPYTARYLSGLPQGFRSYPHCLVRTEVHESVRRDFPELAKLADLPTPMQEFLTGAFGDEWMTEVMAGALSMLVRDAIYAADEPFYAWRYDEMVKLFRKPMYRVMMFLLSPSLILMSSTKKWATFHRGSTLTATPVKRQGKKMVSTAILSFPEGLFNNIFARLVATTYQAALDCSGARAGRVGVEEATKTQVSFVATWDA